jgi:hypothetical protein
MTFMNRYAPQLVFGLAVVLALIFVLQDTTPLFYHLKYYNDWVWNNMMATVGPAAPLLNKLVYWILLVLMLIFGLFVGLASGRDDVLPAQRWTYALTGIVIVTAVLVMLYLGRLARGEWYLWEPTRYDWRVVLVSVAISFAILVVLDFVTKSRR